MEFLIAQASSGITDTGITDAGKAIVFYALMMSLVAFFIA